MTLVLLATLTVQGCEIYQPSGSSEVTTPGTASNGPTSSFEAPTTNVTPRTCLPGTSRVCSQTEQGTNIAFPGGTPIPPCRYGFQYCAEDGVWGPCLGAVEPDPEDKCDIPGDDSNCDGAPSGGCTCFPSIEASRPCSSSIGQCRVGTQYCENGVWGQKCHGGVLPAARESCDNRGLDLNCNGLIGLEDPDCECLKEQAAIPCRIEGQKGDCSLGSKRCVGGQWSGCEPLYQISPETCATQRDPSTGDEDCDGLVNETDNHGPPLECQHFMLDEDGDGWGAIGPSFLEDPRNATHGCFCDTPPSHLSFVPANGKQDQDCGDCQHGGATVHPGVTEFFVEPSTCLLKVKWPYGTYDYDCNRQVEKQYTGQLVSCAFNEEMQCRPAIGSGYWNSATDPECGESEYHSDCKESAPNGPDSHHCAKSSLQTYLVDQSCR